MADRFGALRRYLGSRKNVAGAAGALAGVGLHLAGVVGDTWPLVAAGLYAVAALVTPRDVEPVTDPGLTDALRAEAEAQLTRVELARSELPAGAERAVRRIVRTLRLVLDRLDRVPAPERLADAAEIVRADLTASLDAFLLAPPAARLAAARELGTQLEMISLRADWLAATVPDPS